MLTSLLFADLPSVFRSIPLPRIFYSSVLLGFTVAPRPSNPYFGLDFPHILDIIIIILLHEDSSISGILLIRFSADFSPFVSQEDILRSVLTSSIIVLSLFISLARMLFRFDYPRRILPASRSCVFHLSHQSPAICREYVNESALEEVDVIAGLFFLSTALIAASMPSMRLVYAHISYLILLEHLLLFIYSPRQ